MNFSFLNTTFLYLLPLSLLPVIIHLFFRRKPKRVAFSDLRFIQLATRNVVPKRKLYELLLLIVRCLIILFICLSFAKPVGYIGTLSSTKQNKQVLILLDCSYSMQYSQAGKSKLQIAIEIANALIDLFLTEHTQRALNKQISVVAFSNRIEAHIGFTNNREHLKTFLQQLKPSFRATDIVPGLEFSYELLSGHSGFTHSSSSIDQTIVIISDMAEHIFQSANPAPQDGGHPRRERRAPLEISENFRFVQKTNKFLTGRGILRGVVKDKMSVSNYNPEVKLVFVDIGEDKYENVSISSIEQNLAGRYEIRISNLSASVQKRSINVELNGKNIFDNSVMMEPKKTRTIELELEGRGGSILTGNVNLQPDALNPDDIYYFVYHLPKQKKILIVDGNPQLGYGINSESYYLATALSDKVNKRFLTEIVTEEQFENFKYIENYDVVFLCNLDEITSKKLALIEKFLYCSDKTLFVFLGAKVNTEKYPQYIAENIGVLQEMQSSLVITSESQEEFSEIDKFELDKIVFRKYFRLNTIGTTELLSLQHAPLLVKKNFATSRIYIFASSADMGWSNFPSKSFYPYFIQSIVLREDKSEQSIRNILTVGETIKFVSSYQRRNLKVLLPTGEYKPVKFSPSLREKGGGLVQFDETELLGFYQIGERVFAVNVSRAESNLDKIDTFQLEKLFSSSPRRFLKYSKKGKDISQELFAAIEGKELSIEFLLLGILLLGIEIFLAYRKL